MKKLFIMCLKFISNWVSYIYLQLWVKSMVKVHVNLHDRSSLVSPQ